MGTAIMRRADAISREAEQLLDTLDELRAAAERLRATARVVLVLDELQRSSRSGAPAGAAAAAMEALSRV